MNTKCNMLLIAGRIGHYRLAIINESSDPRPKSLSDTGGNMTNKHAC